MRFYWAIVWALTCNFLQASPISWPTASSRVGQNIYEACDSDMYIAEFLHPEHSYNCISHNVRMFSSDPVGIGDEDDPVESIAMCSDQILLICLCGSGLGYCPSKYRVARYYICSNPFQYPTSEPVEEAYDGPYAALIASSSPYDCSKPSDDTKVDPSGGDSYGSSGTGDTGSSEDDSDNDTSDSNSDDGDSDINIDDYDCRQTVMPGDYGSASAQCDTFYNSMSQAEIYAGPPAGAHVLQSCLGLSCTNSPITTDAFSGCYCRSFSEGFQFGCSSTYPGGCWQGATFVGSCYEPISPMFYNSQYNSCSLSIPAPDGSTWTETWNIPSSQNCSDSCAEHKTNYTNQYPPGSDNTSNDSDKGYEECETSPNCNWVGAPMGFGVCHCDDDTSTGDEGTGPTSHDGRSSGSPNGTSIGVCGKGRDGTSCEDTQQKVLSAVSELGENFENFSKVPTDHGQNDLNSLGSQFETDINSNEFSDAILNDSAFLAWKEKFLERIQTIRLEATQLAQSIVVESPVSNGPYGCLEFDFSGQHFGPECLSEYLQPAIPYLSAFLEFLKYLLGFFILFRGKN